MDKILNYEKIGGRIEKARTRKDFTQQELAGIINVSVSHLSNIETGKAVASFEVMFKLALTLDVSLDELVKDGKSDDFSIERQILHDCDEFERMIIRETMYSLKRSIREHKISK